MICDNFPYTDNPTLAKAGLHGPVKTVCSYIAKGGVLMEELTFDAKGRLVKEMYYHPNTGKLLWTHLYAYNETGLLLKATASGQFVKETGASGTYAYDGKGNLLTLTIYDTAGKPLRKFSSTYDAQGHKLTEDDAAWDSQQQLHVYHQECRRYNEYGDIIAWRIGGPKDNDAKTVSTTYQYAPDGAMLRSEDNWSDGQKALHVYTAQGKLLEDLYIPLVVPGKYSTGDYKHERYTYNKTGNVTQLAGYDEKNRLTYRREYDYNTAGKKIEERFYNSRPGQQELTLWRKLLYRYDKQGQKIEETVLMSTDRPDIFSTTVHHWSYDAYGNMIDMPNTNSYHAAVATYREYTYFK
jgi:hypothetical protein